MTVDRKTPRLTARGRITLVTSALVLLTTATTVTAIVLAMGLIPQYRFTTATPAGTVTGSPLPSEIHAATPTPVQGVVISDPLDVIRILLIFGIVALVVIGGAGVLGSWIVAG